MGSVTHGGVGMTGGRFARAMALLLPSAVAMPTPSVAQTAAAASSNGDEIIVTATRREATLNSVPLSIQALTGKSLAEQGSFDFNSYSRNVTGLSALDRGPGQQLITIRGVSSDSSSTNTDAPESKETTAIYFDDTPVSYNGFNPDLQLVDIDRVEVLKGLQGTLFGAGALAGVIRIIGRKPDLNAIGGHAEGDVSNYSGGGLNDAGNATINLPIATGTAALRVTGYARHEGGFIDNVGLDRPGGGYQTVRNVNSGNTYGVRGQLRVKSGPLDVTFKAIRQETKLRGTQNVDVDPSLGGTPNPDIPPGVVLSERQQFRRGAEPYRDGITILNADAKLSLGAVDLFSSTSYLSRQQNADIDFSNFLPAVLGGPRLINPGFLANATRGKDVVQELRLVSATPASPFQWVIGAFYDKGHKSFQQDLFSVGADALYEGGLGSDNLLHTVAKFRDTQYAFFGEASYRLGALTA